MRLRSPASRGSFRIRFSAFDTIWALWSPWLALCLRDIDVIFRDGGHPALLYCSLTFAFTLLAFLGFSIRDGMTRYFSVHDALQVMKAVLAAELTSAVILFSVTRLEGIPRSTPTIHALLLLAGLIGARLIIRMLDRRQREKLQPQQAIENIVMIGATRLTSHYIAFLEAYRAGQTRIVAILDEHAAGGALAGIRVLGPPQHLAAAAMEFAEHGIAINRVIVGGDRSLLSRSTLIEVERACRAAGVILEFVPQLVGLQTRRSKAVAAKKKDIPLHDFSPPRYFAVKRAIDLVCAIVLILVSLPLFAVVAAIALLDVGSPVSFWQQRVGRYGQPFLVHKFRSLKPSFDRYGHAIPNTERLSWAGRLLRRSHLDELPQLLNVLVGDMSLIGPRPLLPHDQPVNTALRLSVRPGITGWAQVNGGAALTADKKNALDEWYIRNASLSLDLLILWKTILFVFGHRMHSRLAGAAQLVSTHATTDFHQPLLPSRRLGHQPNPERSRLLPRRPRLRRPRRGRAAAL